MKRPLTIPVSTLPALVIPMSSDRRLLNEIQIDAPTDVVWLALTEPGQIHQWFGWQYDGLQDEITQIFGKGVKIEVGDMLPSSHYAERLKRVPKAWEKAFEVNPSSAETVRAACVEFMLAGLYATDRISRSERHGRIQYDLS